MSDLQCPARIVLARSTVSESALADLRRRERVVVEVRTPPTVDLDELADLHRGEAVLVVSDEGPHVDAGPDVLVVEIDGDGRRYSASSTER